MATTSFIKKAGMDMVSAVARSAGSEAGKRLVNGKPQLKQEESVLTKIRATKEVIGIINNPCDWDVIDHNASKVSEYVKLLAPVAGMTLIRFVCLPVLVGASAFAVAGTGAATLAYSMTNGTVILGGLCDAGRKIIKHNSALDETEIKDDFYSKDEDSKDNCEDIVGSEDEDSEDTCEDKDNDTVNS